MTQRSSDPRPGDQVMIHITDSPFNTLKGTIRNVYQDTLAVSIVVHPTEATDFMKANVPLAPDGGYHILAGPEEYEIIQRRTYH